MDKATPIFTKTFDFITWLLGATNHFPRSQRFVVTKRLSDAALNFQELLVEANVSQAGARLGKLNQADGELDKVRLYLRMTVRWNWISSRQYEHAAKQVTEIGRLLGGWKRVTRQSGPRKALVAGTDR